MQNQGGSCDSKVGPDAAVFCEAEQLQIGEGSALAADWKPPEHWIPPNLLRRARFRAPRLPWVAETRQPLDRPRAQRNLRRSAVVPSKKTQWGGEWWSLGKCFGPPKTSRAADRSLLLSAVGP
jgi:hypothetical protein